MKIYNKDRRSPVQIFDDKSEIDGLVAGRDYSFSVALGEYFVVQLVLTETSGVCDISVDGLRDIAMVYNIEGTDKNGSPFKMPFIASNALNPIYIGYDFDGYKAGNYSSVVTFAGTEKVSVKLNFVVENRQIEDHGYGDIKSLSRLNWLNSTIAHDDEVVAPYTPIVLKESSTLSILGRDITLSDQLEIVQVASYYDEGVNLTDNITALLLARKSELIISGEQFTSSDIIQDIKASRCTLVANSESARFVKHTSLVVTAEGQLDYTIKITAKSECNASVTMSFPYQTSSAVYAMGLGKKGGKRTNIDTKWGDMRHDSLYVGTINIGSMVKFKAENYRNPLVNVYYHNLPIIKPTTTWDNHGAGNIALTEHEDCVTLSANTGEMEWTEGVTRTFCYSINITPYKYIDYKQQYSIRYYHSNAMRGKEYKHLDTACRRGLNYINVHHGNELHPYINYPFIEVERLKKFVKCAGNRGVGVKVYYTTREMSNHTAEVFAFKALGSEIIMQKKGQGLEAFNKREWLDKYFGDKVIQAWQVHYRSGAHKGDHDIAFIIQPDSRLDNYYIEGLQWLVDNIGIKGIYIDDTSLDATTLRRAKKVLSPVGGLIDMHMWNHEEARAGDAACMNIYCDILPYIDSLWIGEGFDCTELDADYIFTEVSGLSYGNMSQMLEAGGDHYVGMIYGMNNRFGWGAYNADKLYRVWDDFGLQDSYMYGYWHSGRPILCDNDNVKTTTYLSCGKALVASYNFAKSTQNFQYTIDVDKLGFTPSNLQMVYLDKCGMLLGKKISISGINKLLSRRGVMFIIS